MSVSSLPGWCRVRRGSSNVVLVAPHGGRRPSLDPATPRERKVNDLHTASLTEELAAALHATAVINDGCDRNLLDLNRIGQISRSAPWFLELLADLLATVLARHQRVQVLIVHGWNVVQPKCDLGVGGVEDDSGLHALGEAALSVDSQYWQTRVATFRAAAAAAGIITTVGERYPAANRSNLLQAFTTRFASATDPCLRRIAGWAGACRIDAMQLELGIPLRWPGRLRAALRRAAVTAFGSSHSALPYRSAPAPLATPALAAHGFHFHDPGRGVTAFTSITPMRGDTGGRLLLFLGGQEIALFTGEEPGLRTAVGGLEYRAGAGGIDLRFHGHATRLAEAGLYLDLEAALAASALAEIIMEIRYEPQAGHGEHEARPGRFAGRLSIDGRDLAIEATGFCDPAVALRGPGSHSARTHLAATFDDQRAFNLRAAAGSPVLTGVVITAGDTRREPRGELVVVADGDGYTPERFELRLEGGGAPVLARPLARMPIIRPLGDGLHARITFGPARFDWNGRTGWGVYEYARRVPRP